MGIDKTEELLKKFDYSFQRKNNELIINLDFSQKVIVDFTNTEKVIIKDKLVGWNFLTGLIEMSIKKATVFNFIGVLILTFLLMFLEIENGRLNMIFFFLSFIIWILLWNFFYLIKAESLKKVLISWNVEV